MKTLPAARPWETERPKHAAESHCCEHTHCCFRWRPWQQVWVCVCVTKELISSCFSSFALNTLPVKSEHTLVHRDCDVWLKLGPKGEAKQLALRGGLKFFCSDEVGSTETCCSSGFMVWFTQLDMWANSNVGKDRANKTICEVYLKKKKTWVTTSLCKSNLQTISTPLSPRLPQYLSPPCLLGSSLSDHL